MVETPAMLFYLILGPWLINFNEDNSLLVLQNQEQGVIVSGQVSFTGIAPKFDPGSSYHTPQTIEQASREKYRIVKPRDNGPQRLSIVNSKETVVGYISFQQNGNSLEFHVHPNARTFDGKFEFNGNVKFASDAFACRFRRLPGRQTVNMAAGPADNLLNDSLFSIHNDCLVEFLGESVQIKTMADQAGEFHVKLSGDRVQTFGVNIRKDFFRSRDVPFYTPIDKKRCPTAPTGWMSWNIYFDKAGAKENLEEAKLGKKYFQPFGMEFWSIESWQGNSNELPVAKFYNVNLEVNEEQFPNGMKKLADDIRALGFRPGMWIVPYGTGNEEFYQKHKSWFLHDAKGKPLQTWPGKFTLDISNPEVLTHLRKVFQTYRKDWGYEFFKIDGMSIGESWPTQKTWKPEMRARLADTKHGDWNERFIKNFRAGLGEDAVILACGTSVTAPGVLMADASRIGADIVNPNKPVTWKNILRQALESLKRLYTHNIIVYNDPDTLMVNTSISLEEARVTTTIVSLPGQVTFDGDKLAELPSERIRLIQQALPVCDVHPTELYSIWDRLPIWNLAVARSFLKWNVTAVFNWGEEDTSQKVDLKELGLDPAREYALYEFWTNEYYGTTRTDFNVKLPAHSVRLFAIHPIQDRPQFLSSDRHVTQGAIDLTALDWRNNKLTGKIKLVENHPTTIRFLANGKKCLKVNSDVSAQMIMENDGKIIAVTFLNPNSKEASFTLEF